MKKNVTPLFIVILMFSIPLWAGNTSLGTGCSGDFTLATHNNGTVYGWGDNSYGQLGNNSSTDSHVPVAVDMSGVLSGKTITAVAAGTYHTVGLASDGAVYAWGYNTNGQLGNNSTSHSHVPVAVDMSGVLSGKTITAVGAGYGHSVALASDGTLYAWGQGFYGQLGNNSSTDSHVPVAVDMSGVLSGKTITALATGQYHTVALASDGMVYTWGWNDYGQLGDNSTTQRNTPVAVDISGVISGKTITAIAAGVNHSVALASDGTLYAWGYNNKGQLGNNSTTDSHVPVAVDMSGILSGKTITSITAGYRHSVALASDGTVYAWGQNYNGQLGNNSTTDSHVPVAVYTSGVLSGKTITEVSAGPYHTVALASDGTVYTWGKNADGQLGDNNYPTNSDVPVQVVNSDNSEFMTPIELVSLTATYNCGKVILNWQTASETDNANFLIYRNDMVISSIEGAGTTSEPHSYSFTDNTIVPGVSYTYVLADVSFANDEVKHTDKAVTIVIPENDIPQEFALETNYPNPFNPRTSISFQLSIVSDVELSIYDMNGKKVATLINDSKPAGYYELNWDASDFGSGIYFYRLQAGDFIDTKKMLLIK